MCLTCLRFVREFHAQLFLYLVPQCSEVGCFRKSCASFLLLLLLSSFRSFGCFNRIKMERIYVLLMEMPCKINSITRTNMKSWGTILSPVRLPGVALDCSPRVQFQCRLSYRLLLKFFFFHKAASIVLLTNLSLLRRLRRFVSLL